MMSQIFQFGLTDASNLKDLGLILWPIRTAFIPQGQIAQLPTITI